MTSYKRDLLFTLINQFWRVITGPLVLFLIPLYLTPIEQGYWYTFSSIAALAVFADLGFSVIILQFAAHEFAYLKFNPDGTLSGDEKHLWKLASFFRFSVKWLFKIISIIFPCIVIGGYLFLDVNSEILNWQFPWIVYSIASGFAFFNSAILCFFEGCNSVGLLQSIRFKTAICASITTVLGLYCNFNLYTLPLSLIVSSVVSNVLLVKNFYITIKQLWKLSSQSCYDWWKEFSSLIWRYAISWCSGYFIFQLFTPIAFKFHGAEFAGKIGISIAMWTAGFNIATSWVTAVTPNLNMLIAERKWTELDGLFKKSILCSVATMLLGGVVFFVMDLIFINELKFFQRLLPPVSMFLLFLCWLAQTYVNSIAIYLRAHKKEPLMQMSFYSAVYITISTYMIAKYLNSDFLFVGFLSSFLIGIPLVIKIFKKQKKEHF